MDDQVPVYLALADSIQNENADRISNAGAGADGKLIEGISAI